MKTLEKGHKINKYLAAAMICIATLAFALVFAYTIEPLRSPAKAEPAQAAAGYAPEPDNAQSGATLISNPGINPVKWTFMVYIDADDGTLEEQAIGDILEMAAIGSSEDVNIVVQLDRIPGEDDSYGDWTDCRRFLISEGATPVNGSEVMNIGEANMGSAGTLVSFVEWAAYNYPAERYALIISSHGKGWEGCCWDETSGNDNLGLSEMHGALNDIYQLLGRPIDVIGFDACLMGMTEVAYEIRDYATVMVASENAEPSSGWPYDSILSQLVETPETGAAQLATIIVDSYYAAHAPTNYTMAAVDLTKIDAVLDTLSNLAQALVVYADTDAQAIKEHAGSLMIALDEAILDEGHGTRWPGSHGLAIYFPKAEGGFDPAYNAAEVSLASDTAWEEFLLGYFTYDSDNWITTARAEAQQYYCKEHIDLYDFCQKLIGDELQ